MHIAIDDTYGPVGPTNSALVSGARRTHVAVVFQDPEVGYIREQVNDCLDHLASLMPTRPPELHFAEIYNGTGIWVPLRNMNGANLRVVEAFASIYKAHRWKVFVQTVDERTLSDHPEIQELPGLDGLDMRNRADLSLQLLCVKLRLAFKEEQPPIHLLVDQGERPPGAPFGQQLFSGWKSAFAGQYASSAAEPLLQMADFLAFMINRQTHLSMKRSRSELDNWFMDLSAEMSINSDDISTRRFPQDFTVGDFDDAHREDRRRKGL